MKRHPSLIQLSKEHHDGLILAQVIKKNAPVYIGMPSNLDAKKEYTLNFYKTELKKHFDIEERFLIPAIKDYNSEIDLLCDQVLTEHNDLHLLIEKLKTEDDHEKVLNQLGLLLEKHIRMEERELFEKIQNHFDEEFLSKLENKLR
ncbi:MAG: hemerythrin domain-containing protein [Melioribacteraceae bacterium]|nr:hemerythrin domain-containing protein [Melioribacteraceae bacterium]